MICDKPYEDFLQSPNQIDNQITDDDQFFNKFGIFNDLIFQQKLSDDDALNNSNSFSENNLKCR